MRRTLLAAVLSLALIVPTAAATMAAGRDGGHPWDNKRVFYLIEYQGRIREKGYFVRRPGSYQKQSCIIYDEEKISHADLNGIPISRTFKSRTIVGLDGSALFRQEETLTGDSGREEVSVRGGEAAIQASGYFGSSANLPVPDGVLFEISGEWLANRTPRIGQTFSGNVLDREGRRVVSEVIRIGDRLDAGAGASPAIWSADFLTDDKPSLTATFTSDGRLLRLESDDMIYQVVTREEFEQEQLPSRRPAYYDAADVMAGAPAAASPSRSISAGSIPVIAIGAAIPAWDTFALLVLQAGPVGQWEYQIVDSPYAQIEQAGGGLVITALRNAPRVDASVVFPMRAPADIQPFLASHSLVPSQNQAISRTAREAVVDMETRRPETNVLRAVSFLAGWVNQEIAYVPGVNLRASATDVLSSRRGCAIGHARLFVAMARSLGIPARVCQGLLVQTGQAIYHAWAETWINGHWVPVDTTVSRVGLPAGYILAERSGPDAVLGDGFSRFLTNPVLNLSMASAGRETPLGALAELTVGDRRTYAAYEGDWLANLYWGFAMRLPAGWNGRARLNSVEILSPDRLANVKCEALEGEFRAGRAELEANIANLRNSLGQFRLVDSRLVSFDPEGATPALFMDFVVVQNNVSLRCRQYVLPRRQRAFRISFWAPADNYDAYAPYFDSILASFEF